MAGRNLRPKLVLKQGNMPKNQPPSNRIAMWMIAISLMVIALCLVWMAIQQNRRARLSFDDALAAAPPPSEESHPPEPVKRIDLSSAPAPRRRPQPPAAAPGTPEEHPRQFVEAANAVMPMVEPATQGGLLPSTVSTPTNGATIISGRVSLKGKPPPESTFTIHDDICGKINGGKFRTRRYVVSGDGGLADVFVCIRLGLEGRSFATPEAASLSLTNCRFDPYVFGLMKDQILNIRSFERDRQEIQIVATSGNPAGRLESIPGKTDRIQFSTPEVPVKLFWKTRPMIQSFGCVVDNPFFAVTDANGNFTISNVPPGNYVLEAYHVATHGTRPGEMERVEVTAGATVKANFTVQPPETFASARK